MSELEKLAAVAEIVGRNVEQKYEENTSQDLGAMIGDAIHAFARKAQAMALRKACEEFSSRYSYSGDMVIDELMMLVDELENDDA